MPAEIAGSHAFRDRGRLKVFVAGRLTEDALEGAYVRAFDALGMETTAFDMPKAVLRRSRLGRIGRFVHTFWPVEVWLIKANRDLFLRVMEARPDVMLVCGTAHVLAGTLSQIKAALPQCRLVLVWPDSLLYCYSWILNAVKTYDLVATYSKATVDPFIRLGARQAAWVPLGFDSTLHPTNIETSQNAKEYADCEASFVGNHTPERERLIVKLVAAGFRIKVWGPTDWERSAADRAALKKYWQGRPLFGKEFALAIKCAPVSLNPINPVTYPAANMRFFEIPGCGGVALSARSPEMESSFPDRRACYYYDGEEDIGEVMRRVLDDPEARTEVSKAAQQLVLGSHTYTTRARQILALLGFDQKTDDESEIAAR